MHARDRIQKTWKTYPVFVTRRANAHSWAKFFFLNRVMSLQYTPVTQSIPCLVLHALRAIQRLNYCGQESKKKKTIYCLILAHLWPCNKVKVINLEDPKQGYNNTKFEKPQANDTVIVESGNTSIIFLEYVRKSKTVVYSWPAWCTYQSYKVSTWSDKNIRF